MNDKVMQLDPSPQAAGDLGQLKRIGVSEQQVEELVHTINELIRGWLKDCDVTATVNDTVRPRPKKSCGARRVQLPVDFIVDPDLDKYTRDFLPEVDMTGLLEVFRLQAQAKHWLYADWRRAFQCYVRNAAPHSGHWAQGQYPKTSHQIDWTQPVDATQIKW